MVQSVDWRGDSLILLDQRVLPARVEYVECADFKAVIGAIRDMVVRGAPAIGISGAYGLALAARQILKESPPGEFLTRLGNAADLIAGARPTAVNLRWALDRVFDKARSALGNGVVPATDAAVSEAVAIEREDVLTNRSIGEHGAHLIPEGGRVLTHCNAGALATGGYGTALGVIRRASELGRVEMVYADETRPFLQGSRLTAWELIQDGIPVTILVDGAAGYLMSKGLVDVVVVGADRVARNGDVANKIGTYSLACLAKEHGIPFYVAAPYSTFDMELSSGEDIPIEERSAVEVFSVFGTMVAPSGASAFNPSFDVTPARFVTGIITERGLWSPTNERQ